MSISELATKASTGDLAAVEQVLAGLTDSDVLGAFNLCSQLPEQPEAAFQILLWVTSRPRPEKPNHHLAWLRAMNNGTLAAIKQGTDAERLEMVTRAMELAPENIDIYHNAACVYCVLGLAEEALDTVVSAAESGYKKMALIAEDSDLDLIRDHPGFQALVEDFSAKARATLDETMARVSREVLRGAPVPSDLIRAWSGTLAHSEHSARPLALEELYDHRPSTEEIESVLGGNWNKLVEETDLVAVCGNSRFIGYHRGEHGQHLPSDGPVVFFDDQGHFEVADTFSELLVLEADQRHGHALHLRMFFSDTHQFAVETDPAVIRERMAEVHRALLDRLADQQQHAPHRDDFSDYTGIVIDGEATYSAYLGHIVPRPWRRGQVMRLGGTPIGVSMETRPRHEGELMAHMATIDLDLVPTLRAKPCFKDVPELRAFAVFVSDRITKVVLLTRSDIETHGEWSGEVVHDLPRRQLRLQSVLVPERLAELDEEELDETEDDLVFELEETSIGGWDLGDPQEGREYLMTLETESVYFSYE